MGSRGNNRGPDSRFKTDADISFASVGNTRPLQRWDDAEADSVPANDLANMSLEAEKSEGRGWDQFAANKEKFGIVPSYDERFYTTEIDRQHPEFADREQRAQQIAKEIESQGHNGNAHIAEERGLMLDDRGLDEEDKYSGVARAKSQRIQKFAALEAEKAMSAPGYLQKQEKAYRREDAQKFNQRPGTGKSSKSSKPLLRNVNDDAHNSRASVEISADNATGALKEADTKPKKKFNFAASAAKASSFKSSISPSPRQSYPQLSVSIPGTGHLPPGMMPGGVMPPMMAIPGGHHPPFTFVTAPAGMHGMMPPPGVVPPSGAMGFQFSSSTPYATGSFGRSSSPEKSDKVKHTPSAIDLSTIKPLNCAFDFVKNAKNKKLPPIFSTPPTWSSTGQGSYVDQFPAANIASRIPAFMAPMNFVYSNPY